MATSLATRQTNEMVLVERRNIRKLQPLLKALVAKARRDPNFRVRHSHFRSIREQIRDSLVEAHILAKSRVKRTLPPKKKGLVKDVRNFDAPVSLSVLPSIVKLVTPSTLEFLRDLYEPQTVTLIANLTTALNEGIRNALAEAVTSGLPPRTAVSTYFANVVDGGWGRMQTLVRTATQLTYGAARQEEYADPEVDEILWGYQYSAVGDNRTRPSHQAQDGVTLPKEDPFWRAWWTPNGYNCRCQVIPLFEKARIKRPSSLYVPDPGFAFSPRDIALAL